MFSFCVVRAIGAEKLKFLGIHRKSIHSKTERRMLFLGEYSTILGIVELLIVSAFEG